MAAESPAVVASGVSAGYTQDLVLESVSFRLERGDLAALVGPNGSGKSRLLKVLAGLLGTGTGGGLILGGYRGRQPRRVVYLPQAEAVDWSFPVAVLDVVLMGRTPHLGWLRSPGRD